MICWKELYRFSPQKLTREIVFACRARTTRQCSITINTDPVRLKQVLNNLISNALKFTMHGQYHFRISGQRQCAGVLCKGYRYRDHCRTKGNNLSPVHAGRCFHNTDVMEAPVSGLSISKALVEMLGGKIWVRIHTRKRIMFLFHHSLCYSQQCENHLICP